MHGDSCDDGANRSFTNHYVIKKSGLRCPTVQTLLSNNIYLLFFFYIFFNIIFFFRFYFKQNTSFYDLCLSATCCAFSRLRNEKCTEKLQFGCVHCLVLLPHTHTQTYINTWTKSLLLLQWFLLLIFIPRSKHIVCVLREIIYRPSAVFSFTFPFQFIPQPSFANTMFERYKKV